MIGYSTNYWRGFEDRYEHSGETDDKQPMKYRLKQGDTVISIFNYMMSYNACVAQQCYFSSDRLQAIQ